MKVYQDVFTNDEVMSEVYPFVLDYDGVIMKVKSSYKPKDQVGNVDIGCGNAFGGNEEEAGGEEASEKVLDVVFNFNLVETAFSKSEFMAFIKNYLKNLKAFLEENKKADRVDAFMKGAQNFIKNLVSKFDEYTFYTGSKESLDGGLVISFWEDETASGPMFYFFADGLKEVKY